MAYELPKLEYAFDALEPFLMHVQWKSTMTNITMYIFKLKCSGRKTPRIIRKNS